MTPQRGTAAPATRTARRTAQAGELALRLAECAATVPHAARALAVLTLLRTALGAECVAVFGTARGAGHAPGPLLCQDPPGAPLTWEEGQADAASVKLGARRPWGLLAVRWPDGSVAQEGASLLRRLGSVLHLALAPVLAPAADAAPTAAARARQARERMLSTAAHEVRGPLHTVAGFLEIVLGQHAGPLTARQHEFLSHARSGARLLAAQLDDLLFLLRAEEGERAPLHEPVDLAALILATVAALREDGEHQDRQVECDLAPLPTLAADGPRLGVALAQVLRGALRATPSGGMVAVRAWVDAAAIHVSVHDAGPQISRQALAHLFERFPRVETTPRRDVTGLGMAVAWEILRQHGGQLTATSTPQAGTTVTLRLPLAARRTTRHQLPHPPGSLK